MFPRHRLSATPPKGGVCSTRLRQLARRAIALTVALGTFSASTAAFARCADLEEQKLFELSALKTELMVVATTCRQEESYNAFIIRYRSQLSENDHAVIKHFTRGDRRAGQKANDTYITNLANARAQEANRIGADFCNRNAVMFREVMSLPSTNDLPAYAAGKDLIPPTLVGACATGAMATASAAGSGSKARAVRTASNTTNRKRTSR